MSRSHSGISFLAPFLVLVLAATPVHAAFFLVDPAVTVASDDLCALPEAIENANTDSQVHADCPAGSGGDELLLTAGHQYKFEAPWSGGDNALPTITSNMLIAGNGATVRRDAAAVAFRLFRIAAGSVTIQNLTISNGLSDFPMIGGGAIYVSGAELTMQNVALLDNSARGDILVFGGALRMDDSTVAILDSELRNNTAFSTNAETGGGAIAQLHGELTIRRSALLDNRADVDCNPGSPDNIASTGGALRVEAFDVSGARTFIFDSTLAGNRGRVGGAIHVVAIFDTGVGAIEDVFVELKRSTVVFNDATACGTLPALGDGIHVQRANGGEGLVFFGNTILHGNGLPINDDIIGVDCSANFPSVSFVSGEGNVLDPDDQCPTTGFDAFQSDINAIINTERQVDHYLPIAGGPAVDLLEASLPANCDLSEPDQLGNFRAAGPGNGGDLCDAGAVELQETPTLFSLDVTVDGDGTGSVSSTPAGIDCPGTCAADFLENEKVLLEPAPAAGSSFDGWNGDCSGTGTCLVSMDQARTVGATFSGPTSFALEVAVIRGPGSGTVTSTPAGIDCPGTCVADFPVDANVKLEAVPASGFEFSGWGVACAGNPNPCTVTMDQDRVVSAVFDPVPTFELTVGIEGGGSGSVTSTPAGIDCPGTCAADFLENEKVLLEPAPAAGSSFDGWNGDCSGTGTCVVSMGRTRTVGATFSGPSNFTLEVVVAGDPANGIVTSTPAGIDCPGTCTADFPIDANVDLEAIPGPGFEFSGWGVACAGNPNPCTVTMDQDREVSAAFDPVPTYELTVGVDGSGSVTSTPAGIECPGTCAADFLENEKVLLEPTAAAGSSFTGWSGDCSGTGTCVVSMDQARAVTATFEQNGFELAVVLAGAGSGRVFGDQGQLDCPGTCSATIAPGTVVTLSISVEPGSVFQGYGGDCDGGNCSVTMDTGRTVYATFLSADQLFLNSFE